jgi:hypothetical protein
MRGKEELVDEFRFSASYTMSTANAEEKLLTTTSMSTANAFLDVPYDDL